MLVLPIGLGTKLRRFPIVTVGACVLWLLVGLTDRSEMRITTGLFNAVSTSGVRDAARKLFVQYCESKKGKDCQKYAVLLWTGFPAKGQRLDPTREKEPAMRGMLAEFKRAEDLRDELGHCGARRRCFDNKDIVWSFLDMERRGPSRLKTYSAYRTYADATRSYRHELKRLCEANLCLIRDNINLPSLLAAQARHGGALHLLGNLAVFLIFGMYVEQRTSRLTYLLVALIGGTLGMAVHTAFFGTGDTVSLGGSANVSAVLGMFFVFFYHARMRLAVWLPFLWQDGIGWRSFRAEVKWCFPLLFVLSDVVGGLDNGFKDLSAEKVAHVAHLTGFAFGALAALLITRFRVVPKPLLFEGELEDLRALQMSRGLDEVLSRADTMNRVNPDNVHALEVACAAALRTSGQAPPLLSRSRGFVADHLQTVCAVHTRTGEERHALKMLTLLPINMPFKLYLGKLGQVSTLKLADLALAQGQPMLALRLYDFYLIRFPLSQQGQRVESTCAEMLAHLPVTPASIQAMTNFLTYHPDSILAARIGAWVSNVHLQRRA